DHRSLALFVAAAMTLTMVLFLARNDHDWRLLLRDHHDTASSLITVDDFRAGLQSELFLELTRRSAVRMFFHARHDDRRNKILIDNYRLWLHGSESPDAGRLADDDLRLRRIERLQLLHDDRHERGSGHSLRRLLLDVLHKLRCIVRCERDRNVAEQ